MSVGQTILKRQDGRGMLSLTSPSQEVPTIMFEDGTIVKGRQFAGRGSHGYKFVFDVPFNKRTAKFKIQRGNESFEVPAGTEAYRGGSLSSMSASGKGALGGGVGSMFGGSDETSSSFAGGFEPGSIGGNAFIPAFLGDQFPDPFTIDYDPMQAASYNETDVKQFATEFADFSRGQISTNSKIAKESALDLMDTELTGLQTFVPQASTLKRQQVGQDNTFNQAEKTRLVDQVLPALRTDLEKQRQRALDYAAGRAPDSVTDAALELGVRSRAADRATFGGFGASSSAARKVSDLMSAEARLGLAQYGEGLLGQNQQLSSSLLMAPVSYSDAGAQIRVTPTLSGSQLQQAESQRLDARTMLDPSTALTTQIGQQQFVTNLEQGTRQFNTSNKLNVDQFNAGNINNFALSKFNYLAGYANAVAAAGQMSFNTDFGIEQQDQARNEESKQAATQRRNDSYEQAARLAVLAGGSVLGFSDENIKEDITDYTDGLDVIINIKPVTFKYKQAVTEGMNISTQVGVIAQRVEHVIPHAVDTKNIGGTELKTYTHTPVIYTLVNAVKELHQRIKTLEEGVQRV